MLASIVRSALRFRVIVVALAALLLVVGARSLSTAPLDVFPEFAPPRVEVQTEAPGLSTEEVETQVSVPLEAALNGLPWLESLRSKSVLGLSSVGLVFADGTDPMRARQLVQERVALEAARLPPGVKPPVVLPPLSSLSRVMKIGLTSATLSPLELTERARWTIRPRLTAVPGVADVAIWGERVRELQVQVDPERLSAAGVTLDAVRRAAGAAVDLRSGGFVDTPNQRLPVRPLPTVESAADLARSPVGFRGGAPIRLGDVARVEEASAPPIGNAVIDGGPGLLLIVEKEPWGNTLEVTRGVEAALAALGPALDGVAVDATIFRPATFIERSVANLSDAMRLGCVLVALVLVLFLFEWRAALISIAAIPLSLLAAALVVAKAGATLNVMTLAGLVIALGEVVDDAIIDVENITRRWRERRPDSVAGALRVVLDASLEVRGAVVYASLIVILVFVPVLFLDGLAGAFFRPLAIAYVAAIAASLAVALTVTPALALLLFRRGGRARRESPLVRGLKAAYRRVLPPLVRRPRRVALAAVVLVGASAWLATRLGEEFLPSFHETDFLMHFVGRPGTSLAAMSRVTTRASLALREIPGVEAFGAHIGRAEVADEVVGPNFTEMWIRVADSAPYAATVARIREVVDEFPGLHRDLLTYLRERVKEVLTGAGASIVVRVFGDDLDRIRARADQVAAAIDGTPGVVGLQVETQARVPQVVFRPRTEQAARLGLTEGDVRRAVSTYLHGDVVGQVQRADRRVDVVVIGAPPLREDVSAISRIRVSTPAGVDVPLADVADVWVSPTRNEVRRDGGARRIDVTCNVAGRDLGAVARDVQAAVDTVALDAGDHAEVLGEHRERARGRDRLLLLGAAALLGVLLLLHADFGAWRPTLIVFATLPFALVGGVVGAFVGGGVLSLGSIVGFVTVLGIAARNGILLVSHYQRLEREGAAGEDGLLLRGAEERLSPILMTALAAGLGLAPLALAGDLPGHEIEYPLAVVILGGLVTSTVLNLLVVPALYGWIGARRGAAPPTAAGVGAGCAS